MNKIIFVTILFFSAFLVLFPSRALASTNVCQASTSQSLKDCFGKLNSGLADTVEITTQIVCSGDHACDLPPISVNRPIFIYGTPNSNAGIKRIDHYDYSILTLAGSTQATISNLVFDDTQNGYCSNNSPCFGSPIVVIGSSNYVFDGITIKNSQFIGLQIGNVKSVTIKNSKFSNIGAMAVWLGINPTYAIIENNVFRDGFTNAILGMFTGTTADPSIIKNNYFINNHKVAEYNVCGSGTDPCPGGQILIAGNTNNLVISNNTIKDGSLNIGTTGFELNGNTSNLTIQNNDIHHNTGAGIYLNDPVENVYSLNIVNNMIYDNSWGNIHAPGANISGNCESAGCNPNAGVIPTPIPTAIPTPTPTPTPIPIPSGSISTSPNPCISNPQGSCVSSISWNTTNASNVAILRLPNPLSDYWLFSQGVSSGTQNTNFQTVWWPDILVLYANYDLSLSPKDNLSSPQLKELGRVTLATVLPSSTPTPSPTLKPIIPGDLDKNNKVDIFDYNTLIQNFGNTTCGNVADIDGNCKVDIFDFNILVQNFGKTQ